MGWELVHVVVDDNSRITFAKVMKDEKKEGVIAFLKLALDYYKSLSVNVARVMTDNGLCCRAKPSPGPAPNTSSGTCEPNPIPQESTE